MARVDRERWDRRHREKGAGHVGPPTAFVSLPRHLPDRGRVFEIACGDGSTSVWFAVRGLEVWGVDVSPVAIDMARGLADDAGASDRCRFDVVDLDDGLPAGPKVDVVVCQRFRDQRLYAGLVERLVPGGLLAVAVQSEVGAEPGRFRAAEGELTDAFGHLDVLSAGESRGVAWLVARV